uniref:Uncharacterized protein n=1 Tax=Ciona savignyi TaxID=51511 RepID=H2YCN4_CIOSA
MEESLENLRELAAGLSRGPSPMPGGRTPKITPSSYQPLSANSRSRNSGVRNQISRSKSLEMDEELGRTHPHPSHLSKSVHSVAEPNSAFRRAIEDAGIRTQLPRPPSSSLLTKVLSPNIQNDPSRGRWQESGLDTNSWLPPSINYPDLESQPVPMHVYKNHMPSRVNVYSRHAVAAMPSGNRFNVPTPEMKVTRYNSTEWVDIMGVSPNHSPALPHPPDRHAKAIG